MASEAKVAKHWLNLQRTHCKQRSAGSLTSRGRGLWVREDYNATLTFLEEFLHGYLLAVVCLDFAAKIVKVDRISYADRTSMRCCGSIGRRLALLARSRRFDGISLLRWRRRSSGWLRGRLALAKFYHSDDVRISMILHQDMLLILGCRWGMRGRGKQE